MRELFWFGSPMSDQDSPREPHRDLEVEPLLHFEPAARKCVRHEARRVRKEKARP